jgi:hypothetical protein
MSARKKHDTLLAAIAGMYLPAPLAFALGRRFLDRRAQRLDGRCGGAGG